MILSKILYDNNKAAEAIFAGDPNHLDIELRAIFESMVKDKLLCAILIKAMNDIADKLEEEVRNGE